MKIKAIAALCKRSKCILTSKTHATQWIGDGYGFYPLMGMPFLTDTNIFTMFDIPENKQHKYSVDTLSLDKALRNEVENENIIEPCKMSIITAERESLPLQTSQGLVFINTDYLKPVSDMEMLEFYERFSKDGKTTIAIKCGLFLVAMIAPFDVITEGFVEDLKSLTFQCETALFNKTEKAKEPDEIQQ